MKDSLLALGSTLIMVLAISAPQSLLAAAGAGVGVIMGAGTAGKGRFAPKLGLRTCLAHVSFDFVLCPGGDLID